MFVKIIVIFSLLIFAIICLIYVLFNPYPYKVTLAEITTSEPKELTYGYDAKLFGLIPIVVESDTQLDAEKCVKLSAKGELVQFSSDPSDTYNYRLHVTDFICGYYNERVSL